MVAQTPKKRIDVGEIGNPSTGDILYDGGTKINDVFDGLYNTFGDQRLFAAAHGVGQQILHATSYYQKQTRDSYAASPIAIGSCHDIDTKDGIVTVTLPNAKLGEGCYFINSTGSISPTRPLVIKSQSGENIAGTSNNVLYVTSAYVRVILWCTKDEGSVKTWSYGLQPMFGDSTIPLETTVTIDEASTKGIRLFGRDEYAGAKALISAKNTAGTVFKTCEVLIAIDQATGTVYSTEFAVLKNTNSEVYDISFTIDRNAEVNAEVKSLSGQARFSIKIIDTIKVGTAV